MVVGATYSEDYVQGIVEGIPPGLELKNLKTLSTILALLDELHLIYFKNPDETMPFLHQQPKKLFTPEHYGKIVHTLMTAVYPFYRSKGMMNQLMSYHLEDMRRRGYTQAVAECTGKYSQRSMKKHGFESRVSVSYDRYETERRGQPGVVYKPFCGLIKEPHSTVELMWKYEL